MIGLLGRLLRGVRAGAHRSRLASSAFAAPATVTVTSTEFSDGGALPASGAGKGVGDNISPPLRWDGLPPGTWYSSSTTSTFRCPGPCYTPLR